jgi:UDP-GlcNAc:undecaprenyl-phosphate GlcNAc-1-phosphate transferase
MLQMSANPSIVAATSLVLAIALTLLVRWFARKYNFVAKPKIDRWHKKPTAMMGGVAIYLATVSASIFFLWPPTNELLVILAGSSFLFLVGLVDDLLHIKPYQKLIGQVIGAVIVVGYGLVLQWTDSQVANICITVFWLIGLTNALNLLDNMDGLAAGIAAIAAMALGVVLYLNGQTFELILVSAFIGALLGFLIFNFNPASIFMGDCGSMFIGFFLASTVLQSQFGGRSRHILAVLAVPVLTLFVPIFDTAFVTILRKMRGQPASQGGRDHTSHRLVALGLGERSAVLLLYGLAVFSGGLAYLVRELSPAQSLGLIALFTLILALIGVYLAKVKVYESEQEDLALEKRVAFGFLVNLSHKRRIFEVLLDGFLIALAYYYSYVILFPRFEDTSDWDLFLKSLPILIILKLVAFLVVGVYRGIWRYTSIKDVVTFGKGVALGSILSILAILLIYRFAGFSRMLFVLDAFLLMAAVSTSRLAFRLFRQLLPSPVREDGRRVLIYGAGDGGELVLRELKNNSDWKYTPVGFVDDDPFKKDKVIHGLPVFGGNGSLLEICRQNRIQDVLLSFRQVDPQRLEKIKEMCRSAEVNLMRAQLKIEVLDDFLE